MKIKLLFYRFIATHLKVTLYRLFTAGIRWGISIQSSLSSAGWRVSMVNFKNVNSSPRSVFRFVHQLVITSLAELKTCSERGLGKGKLKQLTAVRDEADYAVLFWNEDSVIPAGFWNRRSHKIIEQTFSSSFSDSYNSTFLSSVLQLKGKDTRNSWGSKKTRKEK